MILGLDVSSLASSQVIMNMQKEITKWWLAGKINDTDYAKVLGYVAGTSGVVPNGGMMPQNVFLASGLNGEEENSTYYDLGTVKNEKPELLLKRVPFKLENHTLTDKIPTYRNGFGQ